MNYHVDLEDEPDCGKPCSPDAPCLNCERYWDKMRREGYWLDGAGWTDKALREWNKI